VDNITRVIDGEYIKQGMTLDKIDTHPSREMEMPRLNKVTGAESYPRIKVRE